MATLQRRMAFRRLSEIEVISTVARVVGLHRPGARRPGRRGAGARCARRLADRDGHCVDQRATRRCRACSAPRARELLSFGLPVSLASISWIGFSNVDYAIIGARLGALQTGFYFRAYTLAVEYQSKVAVVMTQVGFPVLARTRDAAELSQAVPPDGPAADDRAVPAARAAGDRCAGARSVPLRSLAGRRRSCRCRSSRLGGASTLVIDAVGTVLMATGRARALLGYGMAHFVVYGLTVLLVVRFGIVAVAIDAAVVHTLFLIVAYVLMLRGSPERPLRRLWDDIAPATVSCLGLSRSRCRRASP